MATTRKPAAKTVAKKTPAKKTVEKKPVAKKTTATKTVKPKMTIKGKNPKDLATAAGEPYINILSVELDPDDIGNGAFELDWNDIFVARLIKAGFEGKTDNDIVDRWFQTVCRNILAENYEQWAANQPSGDVRTMNRKDLGDGRTEIS
jgi:hypothetical protein